MSTPYLSEIKICSFGYAPKGWAMCNGQLMAINQNQAIFALLGTTFGGDGRVNFALPNLQGRVPVHMGGGVSLGQMGGEQNHTLVIQEIPVHTHVWGATNTAANAPGPSGNMLGGVQEYNSTASNLTAMYPTTLGSVGGSQPHVNMQPFLTLNFVIALTGIFPSQN
ncbi:MAG TPA: tail fiber protein [Terracidiphilus sp.]|nr:tail fiber protein [Terracidiphilus sp.]